MPKLRGIAGVAALVLVTGGFAVAVVHDPPDAPGHVARECAFIAALETHRMAAEQNWFSAHAGPAPFEIWRAEGKTSGTPDLSRQKSGDQPWGARLLRLRASRTAPPIDCSAQLDTGKIPRVLKFNAGPTQAIDRMQYSRVTFSPGDRYALAAIRRCWLDPNGWDEKASILIWKKSEAGWESISGHTTTLLYESPRFKPPMRCFENPRSAVR